MSDQTQVCGALTDLGRCLRQTPSVKDSVMRRIIETGGTLQAVPATWYRSRLAKAVVSLVVFLLVALALWSVMEGDGAGKAFAAAMDGVRNARTFSCKQIFYARNGQQMTMSFMFKEPDLERVALLDDASNATEVQITDYGQGRQLVLNPKEMVASLMDISGEYDVAPDTGELKLSRLDTGMRDRLMSLRAGVVEDLGPTELDVRSVRLLQSQRENRLVKVWIDPQTGLPLQIELNLPEYGQRWVYTSIKIDEELDNNLFSLHVPDGYRLWSGGLFKPTADDKEQLFAKMRYLILPCIRYAQAHDNQFPEQLADLYAVGITHQVIREVLAAPGRPDGPAVIRYRQPRGKGYSGSEVVLYESFDQWPAVGVAACFADGHCEVIADQKLFEELVR